MAVSLKIAWHSCAKMIRPSILEMMLRQIDEPGREDECISVTPTAVGDCVVGQPCTAPVAYDVGFPSRPIAFKEAVEPYRPRLLS